MGQNIEILINLAKKTGLFGNAIVKTTLLAKELGISQQTSSRKLKQLEEKGYIKRTPTIDGFEIILLEKTRVELKKMKNDLDAVFKGRDELSGFVETGLGEGRFYTEQEKYNTELQKKLGFRPYPGTLNLKSGISEIKEFLNNKSELIIEGFKTESRTFGNLKLYPAKIEGHEIALVLPARSTHPPEIIEAIAPFYMRDRFNLKDGDKVVIK